MHVWVRVSPGCELGSSLRQFGLKDLPSLLCHVQLRFQVAHNSEVALFLCRHRAFVRRSALAMLQSSRGGAHKSGMADQKRASRPASAVSTVLNFWKEAVQLRARRSRPSLSVSLALSLSRSLALSLSTHRRPGRALFSARPPGSAKLLCVSEILNWTVSQIGVSWELAPATYRRDRRQAAASARWQVQQSTR